MDRIKKHALAHPWTDLRKAHSTGKGPTGHRHSHTVKAGPEDGRFRCHHPPVTEYRDHDSRQTFCKTAPSHMVRDDTGCISIFVLWGSFLFFRSMICIPSGCLFLHASLHQPSAMNRKVCGNRIVKQGVRIRMAHIQVEMHRKHKSHDPEKTDRPILNKCIDHR